MSDSPKTAQQKYRASQKGRIAHRADNARYQASEKGRTTRRSAAQRYWSTKGYLNSLSRRYGISGEDFCRMLQAQENKCACCRRALVKARRGIHVDHCHETGEVRGILCRGCNHMLGHAGDSIETLDRGIKYLEKWRLATLARKLLVRGMGENSKGTNLRGSVGEHKSFISSETGSTPATATNLCGEK